jgi:hypothetical protein
MRLEGTFSSVPDSSSHGYASNFRLFDFLEVEQLMKYEEL